MVTLEKREYEQRIEKVIKEHFGDEYQEMIKDEEFGIDDPM